MISELGMMFVESLENGKYRNGVIIINDKNGEAKAIPFIMEEFELNKDFIIIRTSLDNQETKNYSDIMTQYQALKSGIVLANGLQENKENHKRFRSNGKL
jgi:hypothetical protein